MRQVHITCFDMVPYSISKTLNALVLFTQMSSIIRTSVCHENTEEDKSSSQNRTGKKMNHHFTAIYATHWVITGLPHFMPLIVFKERIYARTRTETSKTYRRLIIVSRAVKETKAKSHCWLLGKHKRQKHLFLYASSHLYKRVCPSVRRSVCRSVRRSKTTSMTYHDAL